MVRVYFATLIPRYKDQPDWLVSIKNGRDTCAHAHPHDRKCVNKIGGPATHQKHKASDTSLLITSVSRVAIVST